MHCTVVDFGKDRIIFNFTDCTREELEAKLELFFSSAGYRLTKTEGDKLSYEKGKRWKRILFGAFSPFYHVKVELNPQGSTIGLMLQRVSSGFSGGLIGINQVRKEFERITEQFKAYFRS